MEVILKVPKLIAPQDDVISTMPDNVLTNILDRLPLQDAVRTGILARSWRYNWTMLSQLVFDDNFFKCLLEKEGGEKKDYGRIISRVLMHIKGAITKFVLYIYEWCKLDDDDVNHWFWFLSNKGVKDITLFMRVKNRRRRKLPTHFFSCLELKHLKLSLCCFDPPATFHGFPNLMSLDLFAILFDVGRFGKFFTQSPILEHLNLGMTLIGGPVKLEEIARLANLKTLSINLANFKETNTCSDGIFELLGSFPKLQELHLDFSLCESFTKLGKRSPTAFHCLKALILTRIDLDNGIMLSCAFELIRCFPNLQTLEITASESDDDPAPAVCSPEVDHNTMGPLQIQSVVFKDLKSSEDEMCLIKYLLASSPSLKNIVIRTLSSVVPDLFAGKLLKLQRAYPGVDIDLH